VHIEEDLYVEETSCSEGWNFKGGRRKKKLEKHLFNTIEQHNKKIKPYLSFI